MNTACSRVTCLLDTAVSKTFRTTKEKSPRCKEVPFKWTWQNITNIPAHLMRNITSFVIPLINPAFVCLLQPFNPSIDDDSKGVFIWTPALLCYEDVSMASHSTMGCQLKHLGAQKKKSSCLKWYKICSQSWRISWSYRIWCCVVMCPFI